MATDKNGNYIKGTKKDLPDGWVTYGFQFALVPNDLDKQRLERAFGCERKVYNEYVAGLYDDLKSIDFNGGPVRYKVPNYTTITRQFDFLNRDNDSFVYNDAKIRFQAAIKKYNDEYAKKPMQYKKSARKKMKTMGYVPSIRDIKGLPKFHAKKQGKLSYTTNQTNGNIKVTQTNRLFYLHVPKFQKGIEVVVHRDFPRHGVIKKATIRRDGTRYLVSVSIDFPFEKEALKQTISEDKILGLDYSQSHLYVDSEAKKAGYPHYHKVIEKRQRRLNKSLARKKNHASTDEEGHVIFLNNYKKEVKKYQKTMVKAKHQRKDFLHKRSDQITNDIDAIVVEDIDLRHMAQCLKLGKNLQDNGFGMFRTMLKYKAEKKGKHFIVADKYFASSKTCSHCGHKKDELKLSERVFKCEHCGSKIDRDYNAALNLKQYGIRILKELGISVIEPIAI